MNPWKRKEVIGNATPKWVCIYALCGPDDKPRYVGKTTQPVHKRFKAHLRQSRHPRLPVHWWMKKTCQSGQPFTIIHLEQVPPGMDWAARERHWIKAFGPALLNLCEGGEGLHGYKQTQEHRDKIAAALRTGSTFSCEQCGRRFWRKSRDIKKGHTRFCSKPCYFVWQVGKPKRNDKGLMGMAGRAAALEANRRRRDRAS